MSATQRRPVPQRVPAKPAVVHVNFGDLDFYSGGAGITPGDYILYFEAMDYQGTKADGTPTSDVRFGVMVTAYPFDDLEHPKTQFLGMGKQAIQSFAPDPDSNGKKIMVKPDAPGATTMNNLTNWFAFLKSLAPHMPKGTFTDDLSVIDGVWVTMGQMAEPEGRASLRSNTGESAFSQGGDQDKRKIPVVDQVLEGGKPWEGGGGFPPEEAPAPTPAPRVPGKPKPAAPAAPAAAPKRAPARAPGRPAPAAVQPVQEEAASTDEDVQAAAVSATASVIGKSAGGLSLLNLRTGVFKNLKTTQGAEMAQAVLDTYFGSDEGVNSIIGEHGYVVDGINVVVSEAE